MSTPAHVSMVSPMPVSSSTSTRKVSIEQTGVAKIERPSAERTAIRSGTRSSA